MNNQLINEQIQIKTKHDTLFRTLDIENTHYTKPIHTNTHNATIDITTQRSSGQRQARHTYATRLNTNIAEDGCTSNARNMYRN